MSIYLVDSPEDVVIVDEAKCWKCAERKLGILQRWPLSADPITRRRQIQEFHEQCSFPTGVARRWYDQRVAAIKAANAEAEAAAANTKKKPEFLPLPPPWVAEQKLRVVRVHCDC